jgi:hypothetical protein
MNIFGGMYGEAFRCLNESIVQAEPDLGQYLLLQLPKQSEACIACYELLIPN